MVTWALRVYRRRWQDVLAALVPSLLTIVSPLPSVSAAPHDAPDDAAILSQDLSSASDVAVATEPEENRVTSYVCVATFRQHKACHAQVSSDLNAAKHAAFSARSSRKEIECGGQARPGKIAFEITNNVLVSREAPCISPYVTVNSSVRKKWKLSNRGVSWPHCADACPTGSGSDSCADTFTSSAGQRTSPLTLTAVDNQSHYGFGHFGIEIETGIGLVLGNGAPKFAPAHGLLGAGVDVDIGPYAGVSVSAGVSVFAFHEQATFRSRWPLTSHAFSLGVGISREQADSCFWAQCAAPRFVEIRHLLRHYEAAHEWRSTTGWRFRLATGLTEREPQSDDWGRAIFYAAGCFGFGW